MLNNLKAETVGKEVGAEGEREVGFRVGFAVVLAVGFNDEGLAVGHEEDGFLVGSLVGMNEGGVDEGFAVGDFAVGEEEAGFRVS